jgi:aconitate hydratase
VRTKSNGETQEFKTLVRIDTPQEAQYYANGGILQFVLRQLLAGRPKPEAVTA